MPLLKTDDGWIKQMRIFIDFDRTIINDNGDVQRECIDTIQYLFDKGHEIYLYSCRSNPYVVLDAKAATDEMQDFCTQHSIPFTGVVQDKPFFDVLIDDRAFGVPLGKDKSVDWSIVKNKFVKDITS